MKNVNHSKEIPASRISPVHDICENPSSKEIATKIILMDAYVDEALSAHNQPWAITEYLREKGVLPPSKDLARIDFRTRLLENLQSESVHSFDEALDKTKKRDPEGFESWLEFTNTLHDHSFNLLIGNIAGRMKEYRYDRKPLDQFKAVDDEFIAQMWFARALFLRRFGAYDQVKEILQGIISTPLENLTRTRAKDLYDEIFPDSSYIPDEENIRNALSTVATSIPLCFVGLGFAGLAGGTYAGIVNSTGRVVLGKRIFASAFIRGSRWLSQRAVEGYTFESAMSVMRAPKDGIGSFKNIGSHGAIASGLFMIMPGAKALSRIGMTRIGIKKTTLRTIGEVATDATVITAYNSATINWELVEGSKSLPLPLEWSTNLAAIVGIRGMHSVARATKSKVGGGIKTKTPKSVTEWMQRHSFDLIERITAQRVYAEKLVNNNDVNSRIEHAYLTLGKAYLSARRWTSARKAFSIATRASLGKKITTTIETEKFIINDEQTLAYLIGKGIAKYQTSGGTTYPTTKRAIGVGFAGAVYKVYGLPIVYKIGHSDSFIATPDDLATVKMEMERATIQERFVFEVVGLGLVKAINHPDIATCSIATFNTRGSGSRLFMVKSFVYGPHLGDLKKGHWNLSSKEVKAAKESYQQLLKKVPSVDVAKEVAKTEVQERLKSQSKTYELIQRDSVAKKYYQQFIRDGLGEVDRPEGNLIYCMDPKNPQYKKWVLIDW